MSIRHRFAKRLSSEVRERESTRASGASCPFRSPMVHRSSSVSIARFVRFEGTYARELAAAVTALGDGAALLDVKQADVTTGGLDDTGLVGPGVVAARA